MSVIASNPHILYREFHHRDQQSLSGGGCCSISVYYGMGFSSVLGTKRERRRSWPKRAVKSEAFWQDISSSRPTTIDMEAITSVEHLDQILLEAKELSQLIIIDWMANWCRKCIYLKPKLEKLAAEFHTKIKFYMVDVNNVSQTLVKRGNISKMPTIQLWKDGEMRAEVIGGHKAWLVVDEVREMIQKYM